LHPKIAFLCHEVFIQIPVVQYFSCYQSELTHSPYYMAVLLKAYAPALWLIPSSLLQNLSRIFIAMLVSYLNWLIEGFFTVWAYGACR